MRHARAFFLTAATLLAALPAFAMDLQAARTSGQVGEKRDGYVAPIAKTRDVVELATDVNARRKAEYLRISKENGQPVDVVAKVAAGEIIGNLPKGAMYQDENGNWKQK